MGNNFHSKDYDIYKELIKRRKDRNKDTWDTIMNFTFKRRLKGEEAFEDYKYEELTPGDLNIDFETWKELVMYMKEEASPKETTLLSSRSKNDAVLPSAPSSQWQRYKQKLRSKGFSNESITNIENDAFNIIQLLSMDTRKNNPVQGLAIGDVQSGKTANMAAVISMAADNGFNFFIILSGVIENLRVQTANRLYNDLNVNNQFNWTRIDNPKLNERVPESDWNNIHVHNTSNNKYYSVTLKNKSRLNNLINWLYSDQNKLKQLKILIIDDEADQASINTKKLEDEDRSTINKQVLKLVNGIGHKKALAINYISYTGTPYANVLNEIGPNTLFPNDFIYTLTPSDDYIGSRKMFGLEQPEEAPDLNIIRKITASDYDNIQAIHKGETSYLPPSFQKAIDWFILVSAMQRHLKYKKPVSMLVHTSLRIQEQEIIASAIRDYLEDVRHDRESYFEKLKELYEQEITEFTYQDFELAMPKYSNTDINDYPSWADILVHLRGLINTQKEHYIDHINLDDEGGLNYHKGIHLVIDNSRTKVNNQHVRLVYPTQELGYAPLFIVVGGNTLSRGLTLEGLVSSYFIRQTKQADTLYQMGRWFGYRPKYELFPRIWMDSGTIRKFEFITQMNTELSEDIKIMQTQGYLPKEVGVKIKNSPNSTFIKITSSNKMQSAIESDIDFSGFNRQTVLFKNDKTILENNLNVTRGFLNSLHNPDMSKNGKMIWRGIEYSSVKAFLSNMIFSDRDIYFSNINAFLEWYDDTIKDSGFENWNVILSSKGMIQKASAQTEKWDIHGFSPSSVSRTRRGNPQKDGKTISIGALRRPEDLVIDIRDTNATKKYIEKPSISLAHKLRKEHGLENVPQLIIYRIDKGQSKDSDLVLPNPSTTDRYPLNFEDDLIGINLMIPGIQKNKNLARKLKINIVEQDDDDEIFSEEFD